MDADRGVISISGNRRSSRVYICHGFHYHYNEETSTTIYFVCASSRCPGRAKWRLGTVFQVTIHHNHIPNLLLADVLHYRRIIIERARQLTYDSFAEIIHQERSRITNREVRSLLIYRTLRPAMQRARGSVFPTLPSDLRGLTAIHQDPMWAHLTATSDGQDSIYSGSVDALDGSHNIVYSSQRNLQVLREVNIIFWDGTFHITPSVNNCYQVFTIVSIAGHTVIPLVWCLMERKTEAAYLAIFVHLRVRLGHWNFTQAVCDFEEAMMNAFRRVFDVEILGCYFHYVNSLGKWARINISYSILCDYPEVVDIVQICCALPLLPAHLLRRGFDVIINEAMEQGLFLYFLCYPFLLYVQTHWVNHVNRGQTLSVSGSPHRTNNASESNNGRMNRRVGRAHPNVFHLMHVLVEFEDQTLDDLNSLTGGDIPTRPRSAQAISNDEFIQSMTAQLLREGVPSDERLLTFLRSVAFSVNNVVHNALFNN